MGIFRDEPLKISGRFSIPITTENQIVQILDTNAVFQSYRGLETNYHVGYYFSLESLKITYDLTETLELATLPAIDDEDSSVDKTIAFRENLRLFDYLKAEFYSDSGSGWIYEGTVPCQNFGMEYYINCLQPYLSLSEIELMGDSDKIGLQILFKNTETTLSSSDRLFIKGNWVAYISLKERISDAAISQTNPISVDVGTSRQQILGTNANRKTLFLQNHGTSTVYILPTTSNSQLNIGASPFIEPNGIFSWEANSPLTVPVWAISESGTNRLVGFEGVSAI